MTTTYEGQEALDRMSQLGAFRDGEIRELRVFDVDDVSVGAELICKPSSWSSVAKLTVRFEGLSEFGFYWTRGDSFFLIEDYKGLLLETGEVYVSVDPYNAPEVAEIPDERDQGIFVAKKLIVTLTMK